MRSWFSQCLALFPGLSQLSVACSTILQATDSWAGPGNKASPCLCRPALVDKPCYMHGLCAMAKGMEPVVCCLLRLTPWWPDISLVYIRMIPQCTCVIFWPIVVSCIRMRFKPIGELHSPSRQKGLNCLITVFINRQRLMTHSSYCHFVYMAACNSMCALL